MSAASMSAATSLPVLLDYAPTKPDDVAHQLDVVLATKDWVGFRSIIEDRQIKIPLSACQAALVHADDYAFAYLVAHPGCDLNAVDEDGNTLAHLVARHGRYDPITCILQKEAVDPNTRNHAGQHPLDLANPHDAWLRELFMRSGRIALKQDADATV